MKESFCVAGRLRSVIFFVLFYFIIIIFFLFFLQSCNESITSINGGVVGNAGYEEVVASTYTGNVFCYAHLYTLFIH
jgi:hypothetical protein